jgi:hypothetical protein
MIPSTLCFGGKLRFIGLPQWIVAQAKSARAGRSQETMKAEYLSDREQKRS